MSHQVTLLVFGILLFLVGLVGKVKAKEIEVGTSSRLARLVLALVGIVLVVLSFNPKIPKSFYSTPPKQTVEGTQGGHEELKEKGKPVALQDQKITNSLDMEFVYIQPGTFVMGSPPDGVRYALPMTQHQVTITKGYYMQTTEVTVGQWKTFVRDTGYNSEAKAKGNKNYWKKPGFFQTDEHPVTCISYSDALAFIGWLSKKEGRPYRLPTEAEWEYAARAGTKTRYSFGQCLSTTQANFDGRRGACADSPKEHRNGTTPVASFGPNNWGLYDMHGNVLEWCQDWCGDYPSSSIQDPIGPSSDTSIKGSQVQRRIMRGGGWQYAGNSCTSAARFGISPDKPGSNGLGFRLVIE